MGPRAINRVYASRSSLRRFGTTGTRRVLPVAASLGYLVLATWRQRGAIRSRQCDVLPALDTCCEGCDSLPMPAAIVVSQAVAGFLTAASCEPAAVVLEGDAGIGKTTLWLSAVEQARERGFEVLAARPAAADSFAYESLTDLLSGISPASWAGLPDPQRLALDRVLLRANADGEPTDQRAVAAGFSSIVEALAARTPVLLAIDDLQWLDSSSRHVVSFLARRLSGRVGVLATVRVGPETATTQSWLQLARPDAITRFRVPPKNLGGLHAVLSERLGRSFPRPTMVRIHEISDGNPFFALELAQAMDGTTDITQPALPPTLTELVHARIGRLDADVQEALLAAACTAAPTVQVIAAAIGADAENAVGLLECAEGKGIVEIDGQWLRFSHPLLARGVYLNASPARRREMHRRLAGIVEEPELKARHLALGVTTGDPETLKSLDTAAKLARRRGAPAAAAELLDLALKLGGDDPVRRMQSAGCHFAAGDLRRAGALLKETVASLAPSPLRAKAQSALAGVHLFDDSFSEAASLLERALGECEGNLLLLVPIFITLAFTRMNTGHLVSAAEAAEESVINAEQLGHPHLLSQALGMRVMLGVLRGEHVDATSLRRACDLEDPHANTPMAFRASMQDALQLGWTGQFDGAHSKMRSLQQRCIERGEEHELMYVAFHSVSIAIWRGDFGEATRIADDAMERALQLGGDIPLVEALAMRAAVAAYTGRTEEARRDAGMAMEVGLRCSAGILVDRTITTLALLEVTLGNYTAALTTLLPLLIRLNDDSGKTGIMAIMFLPDAAEALVGLGRLTEAEQLVDRLELHGGQLDRPWLLAVGGRCRALLLAAGGDVDAASLAAEHAMAQHDRLPMPFERARTQLLLGQLQRRQRRKDAGAATVREALNTFEHLGTPLWADRARAELARANIGPRRTVELTPSEQQVAELAAAGKTNRDIAATLFISPKTVEVNLSRIYRKLGIRSRVELGQHVSGSGHHDA